MVKNGQQNNDDDMRKETDVKNCNGQGKSRIVDYLDYHDLTTLDLS